MYRVHYLTPDPVLGRFTLTDIPRDTKYIGITRTLPDLVVTVQGDTTILGVCRAGGSAVIGMPTDLGGFELPSALDFIWQGAAGSDTEGGAWASGYGATVILSSFPLRTEDAGVVLVGQGISPFGRTVTDPLPGAMAQRYMEPSQGAAYVAATPAAADAALFCTATPVAHPLAAGVWTALSGCYRAGASDARLTVCEVSRASVAVNALVGGPLDLMLTYWQDPALAPTGPAATAAPTRYRPYADYPPGAVQQMAGVQRPDVPALGANDPIISRAVISAPGVVNLADLGGHGPMIRDPVGYWGMKLYARSVAGGSITGFTNWAWTDGPAQYVP